MPDENKEYSLNYEKFTFAYGEEGTDVVQDISISLPEGHVRRMAGA